MLTLVIANRNYSSWSLRPWLALKEAGIPFRESRIPLGTVRTREEISKVSPSGRLPVLLDGNLAIWDSLAICEYLAERQPTLWPAEPTARAMARSISAEMHSGFVALRANMPMNCRTLVPGAGRTPEVDRDIGRILGIWEDCRSRHETSGPFLFGRFSIADAMYAPVVWRFRTYAVELPPVAKAYSDTMQRLPAMQEWLDAARAEAEVLPQYETVV
jgi:glutathione S-transferase